jgi:hypothetical protein
MEHGKTLLARALREIAEHEAWQSLLAAPQQPTPSSRAAQVPS